MPSPFSPAALAAPIFVLLWSTGFIGAKYGLPYAEPATFLILRFALVAAALAVWVVLSRRPWPTWRQAREAALLGVLLQAVYLGGVYQAISMGTEAGVSALIVGLQPVLTAIIARQFLGERLSAMQWAGIALGCLGVGLVVLRKLEAGIGDLYGVLFCLASLVAIAVASILQKRHGASHPVRSSTLVQFLAALVFLVPFAMIFETREVTWSAEEPDGLATELMGDVRLLDGGHRLVGWSGLARVDELADDGSPLWQHTWDVGPLPQADGRKFAFGRVSLLSTLP